MTVTTSIDRQRCWSRRAALMVGLAGLTLPLVRPAAQAAAQLVEGEAAGLVSSLVGRATATLDSTTRTLHRGAVVHPQDSLATEAGARLKITLADGSTLAIGERSRLVLTSVIDDAGRGHGVVLDLVAGIVRAVLGPSRPEIFEVRGRVAVAAARSTDFFVETESRRTAVFVAAGEVAATELYGDDAALLVAGEGIDIRRGVETGQPVRWGQGRIDDFVARTLVDG